MGMHRSRTAAEMFSDKTRYRGIFNNTVKREDLIWADRIYVMETNQRKALSEMFPEDYMKKTILCLDIPDVYSYRDEVLKKILKNLL